MNLSILLLLLVVSSVANGYQNYQHKIPNGDRVPHPCKINYLWHGVGHHNPLGNGARNQFGIHFAEEKHEWTTRLCGLDSDGDGMTNGEELGDPKCIWKPNTFASRSKNITHPGVCNPWGSTACEDKNKLVSCDTGEFECKEINKPSVQNITLRFEETEVPATKTNYYCMIFELPKDQDYHLIASKAYIDNAEVMHHILLFSCSDNTPLIDAPVPCGMAMTGCSSVIGKWTVGIAGECLHPDAGFKIGQNGVKRVALQFHWNNPERRSGYKDSSGLTLYYTSQLRKYNAGTLWTGQGYLDIPPGSPSAMYKSTCSGKCTKILMKEPIYITSGVNHMHYLGYSQHIEVMNGGGNIISNLTNEKFYSYDNPVMNVYNPPVKVSRGDSFHTTCKFRSLSKSKTTYNGDGTNDEMCLGIFTFYPAEAMPIPQCITWKNIEFCEMFTTGQINGCHFRTFMNFSHPETKQIVFKVMDNCNHYGSCRKECPAALAEVKNNICLAGETGDYILDTLANSQDLQKVKFAHAFKSCDCAETLPRGCTTTKPCDCNGPSAGCSVLTSSLCAILFAIVFAKYF